MTEPTKTERAAAEMIGLIVNPNSPYAKDSAGLYDANLADAERIIQRMLDSQRASSDAESHNRLLEDIDTELGECQEWEGKSYQEFWPQRDGMRWRTRAIMAESEIERLKKENKILEMKSRGSLANNLCPDCRDKIAGMPCLRCNVQRLEQQLTEADSFYKLRTHSRGYREHEWQELKALRRQIAETNQEKGG